MPEAHDLPSSGRALVRLVADNTESHHHVQMPRPSAFVAQLIASARRLPQARERRRADPAEVIAAYQATVQRIRNLNQA
jgi:hypothetical protein